LTSTRQEEAPAESGGTTSKMYPLMLSYLTLRRIIGWIAVLLPVVLVAAKLLLRKQLNIPVQWPDSASGFYYTGMRDVFVGSLCALGVFLLAYRGYDRLDFWITFVAGLCAIGVALFPTKPSCQPQPRCLTSNQNLVGNMHNGFAITLITLMGFMALRFAKSIYQGKPGSQKIPDKHRIREIVRRALRGLGFLNQWPAGSEPRRNGKPRPSPSTRLKRHRNFLYRVCAAVTLICAILFLLQGVTPWLDAVKQHIQVFLLVIETIAIFSFGAAWFVKGRSLLPIHRRKVLRNPASTHYENVDGYDVREHAEKVQQLLANDGMSAGKAAHKLGISRQRVTEIAAEIT
jgi:hypothetical protein